MKDARQTIVDLYAAFGRADVPGIFSLIHDDASWGLEGAPAALGFMARGKGKQAAGRYFEGVGRDLEMHGFAPLVIAADGDRVLALVEEDFTVRPTGKRAKVRSVHAFRVVNGLVVDYAPVIDCAAFVAAFTK
jgi:uncharacterized protein